MKATRGHTQRQRPFLHQRTRYPSRSIIRLWPFYTKVALSVWTNLGKHLQFVWLCISSIKTGTRRIKLLDELSFEIRLERRTTKGSSSGRIMRLVSVFILETHNPDELQNVCPSSSRRIMHPQYKNSQPVVYNMIKLSVNPFTARVLDGDSKVTLTFESVDEIL